MTQGLTISSLARRAACSVETIRFYEREGLLPPPRRTDANYRLFDEAHVERLTFIRRCRLLDITLGEIRTLLNVRDVPDANCADVNILIDAHIHQVEARIEELERLREQLKALRHLCGAGRDVRSCGILESLSRTPTRAADGVAEPAHPKAGRNAVHACNNPSGRR